MRLIGTFESGELENLLPFAAEFSHYALYNSNAADHGCDNYDKVLAIGCLDEHFNQQCPVTADGRWWFGITGYDFKKRTEEAVNDAKSHEIWPEIAWFSPAILLLEKDGVVEMLLDNEWTHLAKEIIKQLNQPLEVSTHSITGQLRQRITRKHYLDQVNSLKRAIKKGSIYEVNFCQEFYAEHVTLDPIQTFLQLNAYSPMPFSGLVKIRGQYALSSSPERFFQLTGRLLRSQPIKGSIARGKNDLEDRKNKEHLLLSQKERSENVMIVDLVRNDIGKIATPGTVRVEELFQVKSFKRIHQMVSTVVGEIPTDIDHHQIFNALFPMGSMTGAPKVKAMQLIEQHESGPRGWYSGCMGYISPNGDSDLSVMIRTLLYDQKTGHLSYWVGGAITDQSDPEEEYDECLLKAKPLFQLFEQKTTKATFAASARQQKAGK